MPNKTTADKVATGIASAEPSGKSNHQLQDKGYKKLFSNKEIFIEFLQTFVKEDWVRNIDEDNLVRVDKEYLLQDYRKKEADIVYRMKFENPLTKEVEEAIFYVLFELQSSVDRLMPYRLLMYMVQIWKQELSSVSLREAQGKDYKLPAIVPIVLYNGPQNWDVETRFKEMVSKSDQFKDWTVDFKYILIDVDAYEERELLEISNTISLIIMMDQNIVTKDRKIFINRLEKIVDARDKLPAEKLELIYEWLKEVLLVRFPIEEGTQIIENMREGKAMTYAIERLFDNIEEESMEKGIEKGVLKVAVKAIRKGMSTEEIADLTDLTVEEVEKIRREIKAGTCE